MFVCQIFICSIFFFEGKLKSSQSYFIKLKEKVYKRFHITNQDLQKDYKVQETEKIKT